MLRIVLPETVRLIASLTNTPELPMLSVPSDAGPMMLPETTRLSLAADAGDDPPKLWIP